MKLETEAKVKYGTWGLILGAVGAMIIKSQQTTEAADELGLVGLLEPRGREAAQLV